MRADMMFQSFNTEQFCKIHLNTSTLKELRHQRAIKQTIKRIPINWLLKSKISQAEQEKFLQIIEVFGKSWMLLNGIFPHLSKDQLKLHIARLIKVFRKNPSTRGDHLLPILIIPAKRNWSKQRCRSYMSAVKIYGEDWKQLQKYAETKTIAENKALGRYLVQKIK